VHLFGGLAWSALLLAVAPLCAQQPVPPPARGAGLSSTSDYIAGFVQYVKWPHEDGAQTWQVCVVAPAAEAADDYARRSARGKPFAVRAVAAGADVGSCHVLDLTRAPERESKTLVGAARALPVLTVGHGDRFCAAGGGVCLRPATDGGGFEINLSAIQQSGLKVNAQLLMLGRKRTVAGGPTP
jgi:hypothetical protein